MITFASLTEKERPLVVEWLHKEHVRPYFHGQGLHNTLDDLARKKPLWRHWIAFKDAVPFGYLITSLVAGPLNPNDPYDKWFLPNKTTITLDLLIGEENFLGKGLASSMIQHFLEEKFPHASRVLIDPSASNARAIHVYEKAGFKKMEEFLPDFDPTPHWMMIMDREFESRLPSTSDTPPHSHL